MAWLRQVRGGIDRWEPLPATHDEACDIEQSLGGSQFGPVSKYEQVSASEDRLKAVRSPQVLHLATHAFFFDPQVDLQFTSVVGERLRRSGNPMLYSGLVLAGANDLGKVTNRTTKNAEDGWVTAEEVASLDLRRTELVVLSACDTGVGKVFAGEGVYSLKRAFQLAGAQSVMATLFKVPNNETRELMRSFYQSLKDGKSKLEALHEAQKEMVGKQKAGTTHPFFWASFTLTGDVK